MTYNIDSAVPLPPRTKTGTVSKYPFTKMAVNDSFAVPVATTELPSKVLNRMRGAADKAGKSLDMKFTARVMGDTVRVWRIK